MTVFFGNAGEQATAGDIPAPPGGTPIVNAAQIMNGNPASSQFCPFGVLPPQPMAGTAAQTINTPQVCHEIARGEIPLQVVPTNVNSQPGTDSFLAQLARGQLILNQSTYGQGAFLPANGGQSPQGPQAGSVNVSSQVTGPPANLTVAALPNYVGN